MCSKLECSLITKMSYFKFIPVNCFMFFFCQSDNREHIRLKINPITCPANDLHKLRIIPGSPNPAVFDNVNNVVGVNNENEEVPKTEHSATRPHGRSSQCKQRSVQSSNKTFTFRWR